MRSQLGSGLGRRRFGGGLRVLTFLGDGVALRQQSEGARQEGERNGRDGRQSPVFHENIVSFLTPESHRLAPTPYITGDDNGISTTRLVRFPGARAEPGNN